MCEEGCFTIEVYSLSMKRYIFPQSCLVARKTAVHKRYTNVNCYTNADFYINCSCLVSTASLTACIPFMMVHEVQELRMFALTTVCLAHWPPGWEKAACILVVLVTYVIPLSIIVVCYTLILKFLYRHRINVRQELNVSIDNDANLAKSG